MNGVALLRMFLIFLHADFFHFSRSFLPRWRVAPSWGTRWAWLTWTAPYVSWTFLWLSRVAGWFVRKRNVSWTPLWRTCRQSALRPLTLTAPTHHQTLCLCLSQVRVRLLKLFRTATPFLKCFVSWFGSGFLGFSSLCFCIMRTIFVFWRWRWRSEQFLLGDEWEKPHSDMELLILDLWNPEGVCAAG